jgi:hypothetical protein
MKSVSRFEICRSLFLTLFLVSPDFGLNSIFNMTSWITLLAVLAACAPQVQASCAYGTHLHRRADVIHAPKFGYSAANVRHSLP